MSEEPTVEVPVSELGAWRLRFSVADLTRIDRIPEPPWIGLLDPWAGLTEEQT